MTVTPSLIVCGIPMAMISHPQGPWLEGINPVTNQQWQNGVEPFMNEGVKYCLLERHYRGDLMARQFCDYKDLLDTIGRDNAPKKWNGRGVVAQEGMPPFFQWRATTSRKGFDGKGQPSVDVSWYEAKAWTLTQGGLYLLTDEQWEWSAQGGEKRLKYATETGKLVGPDGKKLIHCSVGTEEQATVDVNDSKYQDGPFGLRRRTRNVWEWIERNPDEKWSHDLRGRSRYFVNSVFSRAAYRFNYYPGLRFNVGFRVGAPVAQDSK